MVGTPLSSSGQQQVGMTREEGAFTHISSTEMELGGDYKGLRHAGVGAALTHFPFADDQVGVTEHLLLIIRVQDFALAQIGCDS